MNLKPITTVILFLLLFSNLSAQQNKPGFEIGKESFELNGKPYVIRCGEMHFARIPKAEWRQRLKMAKAMGLNTVCAYLFWNIHEKQQDQFTWTGQSDAAEFCKIAKEEGLYVILRPGPYSCAEWDFGGFPWWLLKDKTIKLRTQHAYYLERAKKYLMEVGKTLAPLQISKGGNIIMVQVENEYGSYGDDKVYMNILKSYLKTAGFDVPLFHCDGPSQLKADHPEGLFAVVNFGSNPAANFKALREIQPTGPLMCGEYYPGWFDSWGRPHHKGDTQRVLDELKYMLDHKASFSIYMAHGGTTFGTYSGANSPPYLPQTTSYDYDAPIDEAGNATPKFHQIRQLFSNYLQEGETLPEIPAAEKILKVGPIQFSAFAALQNNLPAPVLSDTAKFMEDLNQDFGAVLYQTTLKKGKKGRLQFKEIHDYALVYLDKKLIGTIDRRKNNYSLEIPERKKDATLQVLVEATGRVNYGEAMHDRKGIHGPVNLLVGEVATVLKNWKHYSIRLGENNIPIVYQPLKGQKAEAGFYKGNFSVKELEDTYLDLSKWKKGLVWINGNCLGRFWEIGPTQTMLVPGSWLKQGKNEVVVFDLFGTEHPVMESTDKPVLDLVNEQQLQAHKKAGQQWVAEAQKPDYTGVFEDNENWQKIAFKPVNARYFCLEAVSSQKNQPFSSVAEIVLLDAKGQEIPRTNWKVVYADSEELSGDDGNAANVFDLQFTSIWHTEWENKSPKMPHQLVIDLGGKYTVTGMKLLPRQDNSSGRIKDFQLYFSLLPFKGI